jgi:hypothetical protein
MGDTVIFNKTISSVTKAWLLYVGADFLTGLATAFAGMDKAQWDAMWWMPKTAFWIGHIASALILTKAFFSNSSTK